LDSVFRDIKGEWDKALEYFLKAEKIRIDVGDKAKLAYTALNISSVYYEKNEAAAGVNHAALGFFLCKKLGMKHVLAQMAWLLDPVVGQVGEDELMRLGEEMAGKKGIVQEWLRMYFPGTSPGGFPGGFIFPLREKRHVREKQGSSTTKKP